MKRTNLLTRMLLLCALIVGSVSVWAENQTFSVVSPSQATYSDATSGISVVGAHTTGKIDNTSGQAVYKVKNGTNVLHVSSVKANIKGISFEYCASKASNLSVYTSVGSQFAVPGSGFTATLDESSQATLSDITANASQATHQTLSVTFTNAVSMLYVTTGSSNEVLIRNITITYDDAITTPALYATITPTGEANTYSVTGYGSMTASKIGATAIEGMTDSFYQLTGTNTYTPAESLKAGDIIVFTMANSSTSAMGIKTPVVDDSHQITFSKSVAKTPYQFVYVVTEDLATVSFARKSSADYLKDIKVYHNKATFHSVSAVTSTGDDTYGTVFATSTSVAEGKTTVITAVPATGYRVSNWAVSGTGASITPSGASNSLTTTLTMGTADATVTCTFEAATTYTISYATGSADGVTGSRDSETKTEDVDFTLPSTAVFSRTGYLQTGWNTDADGESGTHYDLGGTYSANAAQTFYPEWTACDYTFVPGANSGSISDGDVITTSTGGKMVATNSGTATVLSYASSAVGNCLQFGYDKDAGTGAGGVTVTLDKKMQAGTIIQGTLFWNEIKDSRILTLHNYDGTKKDTWNFNCTVAGSTETFTYTVTAGDGLAGSNVFKLLRGNSVHLISLNVINCADVYAITPAYEKTTYVTPAALDFTDVDGLKAYVATGATAAGVTMTSVGAVPAGTPLMLIGTAGETYDVPVAAAASAPETNLLQAGDGTTEFSGSSYDYILYSDGKFYQIGDGTVAVGKAYLHLDTAPAAGARSLNILFDDESVVTGISATLNDKAEMINDNSFYNLNGQRIAQPSRGLYIVNGRKVIIR